MIDTRKNFISGAALPSAIDSPKPATETAWEPPQTGRKLGLLEQYQARKYAEAYQNGTLRTQRITLDQYKAKKLQEARNEFLTMDPIGHFNPESVSNLGLGPSDVTYEKLMQLAYDGKIKITDPGERRRLVVNWTPGWDASNYQKSGAGRLGAGSMDQNTAEKTRGLIDAIVEQKRTGTAAVYDYLKPMIDAANEANANRQEKAPTWWEVIEGAITQGSASVVDALGATLYALEDNIILKPLEWLTGVETQGLFEKPYKDWHQQYTDYNQQYQQMLSGGDDWQQGVGKYLPMVTAAVPQVLLTLATSGASTATTATLQATSAAAQATGATATVMAIANTAKQFAMNPSFQYSFASTFGNEYNQAKEDGANDAAAYLYAMLASTVNAAVEVGGGVEGDIEIQKPLLQQWAKSAVEEGGEEVVQGIISQTLQNVIYNKGNALASLTDENAILSGTRAAEEFAGGAIVGGLHGAGQVAMQAYVNNKGGVKSNWIRTPQNAAVSGSLSGNTQIQEQNENSTTDAGANAAGKNTQVDTATKKRQDAFFDALFGRNKKTVSEADTVEAPKNMDSAEMRQKIEAAYAAGEMTEDEYDSALDALMEQESLEGVNKLDQYNPDMIKTEVNNDGRGSVLDESGERTDGQSAREQAGELAEGTGRDQSGQVQSQRAGDRADRVARIYESEGLQPVTAHSYLGSDKVEDAGQIYDVPQSVINSDAELSEIVADIRNRGMTPHLFVGEARLRNGGIADAMIRGNDVYIRVDSPEWTATQNWEHEKFHGILGKSREMIRDLWQQMKRKMPKEKLWEICKRYREAYHGIIDVDENGNPIAGEDLTFAVAEEILADAYAGKDTFAQDVEQFSDIANDAASQIEESSGEIRGPPKGEFSAAEQAEMRDEVQLTDVSALRNIGRKSVNDFSAEEVMAAKKWAEKFYREMGIKSPFFRAWFGDWRANDLSIVSIVNTDGSRAFQAGKTSNADTGKTISWGSDFARETRNHLRANGVAYNVTGYINEIVKNAILLDTKVSMPTSKTKMPNTAFMHEFYSLVRHNGNIHLLKLYVEEAMSNKATFVFTRAYQLKDIKKVASIPNGVLFENEGLTEGTIATNVTVADIFNLVKQYDAEFNPMEPSAIVDNDGNPQIVYHGTNQSFRIFKSKDGTYWFSENEDYAESMAEERGGDRIIPVYLNMRKPYRAKLASGQFSDPTYEAPIIRAAKEAGHDGVIIEADTDDPLVKDTFYIVFDNKNIKSADNNIGTFDRNNPDIYFSTSGAPAKTDSEATTNKPADIVDDMTADSSVQDPVQTLPKKAQRILETEERKLTNLLANALRIPYKSRGEQLDGIARAITTEFLQTGNVSEKTLDDLFESTYRQNEQTLAEKYGVDIDEYRDAIESDFKAQAGNLIAQIRLANRYAAEQAKSTESESSEQPELTKKDLEDLYDNMKSARRTADKAVARNLLTESDSMKVNRLLRGDIDESMLNPLTDNVNGILEVFRAKAEYEKFARQIRRWNAQRKERLYALADKLLETAGKWKDKSAGWKYSRETMERNIRDIVKDKKLADEIIDTLFKPVHDAAAKATKMKNEYRDRVRALKLSRKVESGDTISEAAAVQLLGEAEDNIRYLQDNKFVKERDGKTLEDWSGIVRDIWESNPSLKPEKIRKAVEEFRQIYDDLFKQMNDARMRNGYEPINYRKGYFPHFQSESGDGILSQFGKSLGINTAAMQLPTTINGMTHTFKPGIQWFGSAQQRKGVNTSFDAVEGFDSYIEGVADVICQTDNIQRLRAFATQVRYRTSDEGIRKQVDAVRNDSTIAEEDKNNRIKEIYENGKFELGNFAVELDEYTNLLAGKKSRHDRDMEQKMGRKWYAIMKAVESRVAANMVAVNPGSWLTNFIPITQGAATLDSRSLLAGMWDTLRAIKQDDGVVASSTFLTNRRGSDPIVRTWAQETSAKLSKPMELIDNFTAGTLVRARFNQNVRRGMSEEAAMADADAWAAGVMADRSKGATPTIFAQTNPITKLLTQFQVEVNNQLSYTFKDIPRETREKGAAALALAMLKFMLGAYLFDELYEYFIGRRPALDPLGIINDTVGDLTGYELPNLVELGTGLFTGDMPSFKVERKGLYDAGLNLTTNVVEELPFVGGLIGGGRLPISSALPDIGKLWQAASDDSWAGEKRLATAAKELAKPALYILPPFGGGQVKKVLEGLDAVIRGGSYSVDNTGADILQYPVANDTFGQAGLNALSALFFGKSSLPSAREWVESNFDSLSAKQTALFDAMRDGGASTDEAYDLIRDVEAASGNLQKQLVVANGDWDEWIKELQLKSLMSENGYKRYKAARSARVSTEDFVKMLARANEIAKERGVKSASQKDIEAALNESGLTREQKRAIWNGFIETGAWKTESPW